MADTLFEVVNVARTSMRTLPVVAKRLEPGDTILCREDGQVHVATKEAREVRRLTAVVRHVNDNKPMTVDLTDAGGRTWTVWGTDVAWYVVPSGDAP